MKTLTAMAVGLPSILASGVSSAQNGNMMHGDGMWGGRLDGWIRRLLGADPARRRGRRRRMGHPAKTQMIQRSATPIEVPIILTEPPPCSRP